MPRGAPRVRQPVRAQLLPDDYPRRIAEGEEGLVEYLRDGVAYVHRRDDLNAAHGIALQQYRPPRAPHQLVQQQWQRL